MFATNEIGSIKGDNKLIKKYKKLLKIRKLSKFQKLAKSKKNYQKVEIHLILTVKKIG